MLETQEVFVRLLQLAPILESVQCQRRAVFEAPEVPFSNMPGCHCNHGQELMINEIPVPQPRPTLLVISESTNSCDLTKIGHHTRSEIATVREHSSDAWIACQGR